MQHLSALNYPYSVQSIKKEGVISSLKILLFFITILAIASLTFYIFQIQQIIQIRYQLKNFKSAITRISGNLESLEIQRNQLATLGDISQRVSKLNFVRVEKISFLPIVAGHLAVIK